MGVGRFVGAFIAGTLAVTGATGLVLWREADRLAPVESIAVAGDSLSAVRAAQAQGSRVEIASMRNESRLVYAEPNGTMTAEISPRPKRVKQGPNWVPIDTTLIRRPDGSIGPRAAVSDLSLSPGGSAAPLVRYGREGKEIALSWPDQLPAPRLAGDRATYAEVLAGVDLVIRAKDEGYTQYLIVKNRRAADQVTKVRLGLRTKGVTLRATRTGKLQARDAKGKVLFEAPESRMWDSSTKPREAFAGVAVDGTSLTLTPDRALLTARTTKYPVTIDPDWWSIGWGCCNGGWTSVLSGSDSPKWNSSGAPPWAQVGQCWDGRNECNGIGEGRSYFQFRTSGLHGTRIISVSLFTKMESGPDCNQKRDHHLYISYGHINSNTKWSNRPDGGHLSTNLIPGCGWNDVTFDAKGNIRTAPNDLGGISTYIISAGGSTDQLAWRRYDSGQTVLKVNFNRYPKQSYGLTSDPQIPDACTPHCGGKRYFSAQSIRTIGYLDDDDPGETLRAEWDIYRNGALENRDVDSYLIKGSPNSTTIDLSTEDGKEIDVYMQGFDRWDRGGFSRVPNMPFTVDNTAPNREDQKPEISAQLYKNDNRWHGGVGVKDTFTLTAKNATDINHFYWGWSNPPNNRVNAETLGGKAVIEEPPPGDGPRTLFVQAADRADNRSQINEHRFYVRAGNGPIAQYSLDGSTRDEAFLGDRDGKLYGGAKFGPGAVGSGLRLDQGTNAMMIAPAPIRTDTSFSVSSWVYLDQAPSAGNAFTAVSQDSNSVAGFYLSYRDQPTGDVWEFYRPDRDNYQDAGGALARSTTPARLKTWTHLTTVYDAPAGKVRLYVNGVQAGEGAAARPAFTALGGLIVGAARWNQIGNYWPGQVDEVKVYDRVLDPDEVAALVAKDNVQVGHWKFDELSDKTANNEVVGGESLVLQNGAAFTGDSNGDGLSDGGAINGGLKLDGTDDVATAAGPAVRTDQSFSVGAWVNARQLAATGKAQTFLSQDGTTSSGFLLQQRGTGWNFLMPNADTTDWTIWAQSPDNSAQENTWTHVAGVYDADAQKGYLYVNGQQVGAASGRVTWSAEGPLTVGRAKMHGVVTDQFPGVVDEVRAYSRALAPAEIQGIVSRAHVSVGEWKLDGNANGKTPGGNGTLTGAPDWTGGQTNVPDATDLAVHLDGAAQSVSAPKTLNLGQSFAVAAWAKVDAEKKGATVVAQDSALNKLSALNLHVSWDNKWTFAMRNCDANWSCPETRVTGPAPQVGVWTHLVAVYDAAAGTIALYINGALTGSEPYRHTSPHAGGNLLFGRSTSPAGAPLDFFKGAIDDVTAYSRVLFADEIRSMSGRDLSLIHHWQLDEPSGGNAADAVGTRAGTAVEDVRRVPGRLGNAVNLDGVGDALQSTGVDLKTDESFTVSAWVYLDKKSEPESRFTAVSVDGVTSSKFRLGHVADLDQNLCLDGAHPDPNKCGSWIFEMPNGDGQPPLKAAVSTTPAEITKWTLLTGVYNRKANQIVLYVDGGRQGDGTLDNAWASSGKLQIGRALEGGQRTQYWPGSVDDIRLYAGALHKDKVSNLFKAYPPQRGPATLPRADAGHWKLDEGSGTTAADASGRGITANFKGGSTWIGGRNGAGAWLDGTGGYLDTAGPVLDTSKSFSASAWVYLTGTPTGHRTVLGQDGSQNSAFMLQYQDENKKWAVTVPGSPESTVTTAGPAMRDEWSHLTVVYDVATKQLRLYVNGELAAARTGVTIPASSGPFSIGRGKHNGGNVDYFPRGIDDVRAFNNRALSDGEVAKVHDDTYATTSDFFSFNEDSAKNDGWRQNHGTTTGGVSYGPGVGPLGNRALQLDGVSGAANAPWRGVLMGDSFTVSAWAKLSSKTRVGTVLGQDFNRRSGMVLQYRPLADRWAFGGPAQDTDDAESTYALSAKSPVINQWTHLVGVYDHPARQLRLYVDGELHGVRNNVTLPNAHGTFSIGRGKYGEQPADYFHGAIDEVRTEHGANTEANIAIRAGWPTPPKGQLGSFVNAAGDHYTDSTDKPVRAGYHFKDSLGRLAAQGPNTRTLFACLTSNLRDGFTSTDPNCEGAVVSGTIGLVYTVQPNNLSTVAISRCSVGTDRLEVIGTTCPNQTAGTLLGYTAGYAPMARYYSPENNGDHWSTTRETAPSYRGDAVTTGWLPLTPLTGTKPLVSCRKGAVDEFSSNDPLCEGGKPIAALGHIYTAPPAGISSVALYRCSVNGQRFTSRSSTCEGFTLEKELGYIPAEPPSVTPTFP